MTNKELQALPLLARYLKREAANFYNKYHFDLTFIDFAQGYSDNFLKELETTTNIKCIKISGARKNRFQIFMNRLDGNFKYTYSHNENTDFGEITIGLQEDTDFIIREQLNLSEEITALLS